MASMLKGKGVLFVSPTGHRSFFTQTPQTSRFKFITFLHTLQFVLFQYRSCVWNLRIQHGYQVNRKVNSMINVSL